MKKTIVTLTMFLTICFSICGQTTTKKKNQKQQTDIGKVDTSIIAILPLEAGHSWIFKNCRPAYLTTADLQQVEIILNRSISDYNVKEENISKKHPEYKLRKEDYIINLTQYNRQYIAVINSQGEKEVWINCFCEIWGTDWKTNVIFVSDGGKCFFNLKINLTKKKYYDFFVNGIA